MIALVGAGLCASPAAAESGYVSGRVTMPPGADAALVTEVWIWADPVGGVSSSLYRPASDGTYSVWVPTRSTIRFVPPGNSNIATEYYGGAHSHEEATVVEPAEADRTGFDVQLDVGGTISGHVSVPSGLSPRQWYAYADNPSNGWNGNFSAAVAANGSYTVRGLPSGTYFVWFAGPGVEYWRDSPTLEGATPVSVTLGRESGGIDPALAVQTIAKLWAPRFAIVGDPVSFVANVNTRDSTYAPGTVEVVVAGAVVGRGTLADGSSTIVVTGLPVGLHTATLNYVGSEVYEPSTDQVSVWITEPTPLRVTRVEPPAGAVTGGSHVRIVGTGFSDVVGVRFGDVQVTAYDIDSPTQIDAIVPGATEWKAGTVPVVVTSAVTGESSEITSASQYTYTTFVGVTPVRVVDGPAGATVCRDVARIGGLPSGATGVMLNVTSVGPFGSGYVVVYPDLDGTGATRPPGGSTVNFELGLDVANSAFVALPPNGRVCYSTVGTGVVRILMDVTGYTVVGSGVTSLTSTRILDTRSGAGGIAGPVAPRRVHTVQVAGRAGVPADAVSVLLNVTVTGAATNGNLRVFPGAGSVPNASVVNFAPGREKANATMVDLVDGKISFYSDSPVSASASPVQVILDVTGYTEVGSSLVGVQPTRVLDTRPGSRVGPLSGPLAARTVYSLPLAATGPVPAGATAVVLNVTAIGPNGFGNLRVYPDSGGDGKTLPPDASSINYIPGRDLPNQVVVALPTDGRVNFYSDMDGGTIHVAADVVGYVRNP